MTLTTVCLVLTPGQAPPAGSPPPPPPPPAPGEQAPLPPPVMVPAPSSPYPPPADSPARPGDVGVTLKQKLLFLKYEKNGFTLIQDTRSIEPGMFGGDVMPIFEEVPEAAEEARSFRVKRIVGFSLSTAGLVLIAIDAAYFVLSAVLSDFNSNVLMGNLVVYLVVAVPALVLAAVGGFLQQSAVSNYFNAVNRYNAAQINKFLPQQNQINLQFFSALPQPQLYVPLTWSI